MGCSGPAAAAYAAAGVPPEGCSSAHAQSAPDMPSTGPATAATDIIWVSTPDSFQHFSFKKALRHYRSVHVRLTSVCPPRAARG